MKTRVLKFGFIMIEFPSENLDSLASFYVLNDLVKYAWKPSPVGQTLSRDRLLSITFVPYPSAACS